LLSAKIIISNKLSSNELTKLGVNSQMKLSHVSIGTKTYLSRHKKQLKWWFGKLYGEKIKNKAQKNP